jgi:predicted regulator of amino acid metabolism with ACT domain
MAGVKGMFEGRRQSPTYVNAVRARIRAGGIVDRLEKHVLGKIEMSASQVAAALGLLRKVVPDVAVMDHTGEVTHNYVARTPEISPSTETWQEQHSPATIQ